MLPEPSMCGQSVAVAGRPRALCPCEDIRMRTLAFMMAALPLHAASECGGRESDSVAPRSLHRVSISSALPWTYSIHGALQQCEPSAVVEPLDYGGVRSTALPLVSLDASTWTGTFFRLNGLDANDPYQPGRPLLLPMVEDLAEMQVVP